MNKQNTGANGYRKVDWRNLPPEQRPAIGETVKVMRGKFQGYRGTVIGVVPKGVQIEVNQGALKGTITVMRHLLQDEDGHMMPEIVSEEERKKREEHAKIAEEQRVQAERFEDAVRVVAGHRDIYEYCRMEFDLHWSETNEILEGEASITSYFDDWLEDYLDTGMEWILKGDERCKTHPCSPKMKKYLNRHPEKRDIIWQWMQEDSDEDDDD